MRISTKVNNPNDYEASTSTRLYTVHTFHAPYNTLLTPQARSFIRNELGYPGYFAIANPLGIVSVVHWCTLQFVYSIPKLDHSYDSSSNNNSIILHNIIVP